MATKRKLISDAGGIGERGTRTLSNELNSDSKKDDGIGDLGLNPDTEWPQVSRFLCLHRYRQWTESSGTDRSGSPLLHSALWLIRIHNPEIFPVDYLTYDCLFRRDTMWYSKVVKESDSRKKNCLVLDEVKMH